jgi:hypothetical protein
VIVSPDNFSILDYQNSKVLCTSTIPNKLGYEEQQIDHPEGFTIPVKIPWKYLR